MKNLLLKTAIAVVMGLFFCSITNAQNNTFKFEPSVSTVTGTITLETFYGPPGFGENPKTDSRESYYILTLSSPIKVIADKNDDSNVTSTNILHLQLINDSTTKFADYKNKRVRLTGTFFSAITGHHHTKVLMDVTKIQQVQ